MVGFQVKVDVILKSVAVFSGRCADLLEESTKILLKVVVACVRDNGIGCFPVDAVVHLVKGIQIILRPVERAEKGGRAVDSFRSWEVELFSPNTVEGLLEASRLFKASPGFVAETGGLVL